MPLFARLTTYWSRPRFSQSERIFFVERLAFLTHAGIPLIEALLLIREQTTRKARRALYEAIIDDIANGMTLAQSLTRHASVLDTFSCSLIAVGEQAGILSTNLTHLTRELKRRRALTHSVTGAFVYPALISIATLGLVVLLMCYVFPKILPIFESLHVPLPLTTRLLILTSSFLTHFGWIVVLGIIFFGIGFAYLRSRYEQVRYVIDDSLVRIPGLSALVIAYELTTLSRILGLLLAGGMTLSEALIQITSTTRNRAYCRSLTSATETVLRGEPLSRELSLHTHLFPTLCSGLISVGERSGTLVQTLEQLATHYEEELAERTKLLSSSLEPILMIGMGLVVGIVAISIIAPLYGITSSLSH